MRPAPCLSTRSVASVEWVEAGSTSALRTKREFIYGNKEREAVIQTVRKNFPLNTMYWAVSEDAYELMDGQQRTISICQYVHGEFFIDVGG